MEYTFRAVKGDGKVLGKVKIIRTATLKEIVATKGEQGTADLAVRTINTDKMNNARAKATGKGGTAKPPADLSKIQEI